MAVEEIEAEPFSDLDEDELQLDYDEKCDEVVELQNELKAANIEAQQLKMRLKAVAGRSPTPVAPVMAQPPQVQITQHQLQELENFVMWLSEHVVLEQELVIDVNLEVPISGHAIQMGRIVQWPLTFAVGKKLRLSAPFEVKDQMIDLLVAARKEGKVNPESLQTLATFWNLVPGELETITQRGRESVVMLAHKLSQLGILVASWPTIGALEAFRALCSVDGEPFQLGQRVEVEYDSQWYVGTLHSLTSTGKASICCDVDGPSVLTVAPCYRVRRHGGPSSRARTRSYPGQQPDYQEPEENLMRRCYSEGNLNSAV